MIFTKSCNEKITKNWTRTLTAIVSEKFNTRLTGQSFWKLRVLSGTFLDSFSFWSRVHNLYAEVLTRYAYGKSRTKVLRLFRDKFGSDFPDFEVRQQNKHQQEKDPLFSANHLAHCLLLHQHRATAGCGLAHNQSSDSDWRAGSEATEGAGWG